MRHPILYINFNVFQQHLIGVEKTLEGRSGPSSCEGVSLSSCDPFKLRAPNDAERVDSQLLRLDE